MVRTRAMAALEEDEPQILVDDVEVRKRFNILV